MSSINLQEIDGYLSEEECLQIIKMIDANNTPSLVANAYNHGEVSDFRTSSTSNLDGGNLLIKGLHQKIADTIGYDIARGESLQGQVYETGQYFKPHTDYFEGDSYMQHCQGSGNRTKTLMIYLNDVPEGGETTFNNLGTVIKPKMGKAVIWDNMDTEGNVLIDSLHEGTPPTKGKKYIVTSWWRESNWSGGEDARLAAEYNEKRAAESQPQTQAPVADPQVIQLHKVEDQPQIEVLSTEPLVEPQPTSDLGETNSIEHLTNLLGLENVRRKIYSSPSDFPTFHEVGFEKIRVPDAIMGLINDSYRLLGSTGRTENWEGLSSVIDGGEEPPEMFSFDNIPSIRNFIHEMLKGMHEAWSGETLEPTMMYGVRSYKKGNELIMHTDRIDTHHISCIIIVDKDLGDGEDWPLHIKDHQGNIHKIYGEPGDMILYESVTCEHGRPEPFQGNFYRNFYAHYALTDYTYSV